MSRDSTSIAFPRRRCSIVATQDVECHYEISLAAYERALQPKRRGTVKGGHFVCYVEQFSPASKEAVASFQEYLM
jgi:hypothetical protein